MRKLLTEGNVKEAEALADATIITKPRRMPPYQPAGDLFLKFRGLHRAQKYKRVLDLRHRDQRVDFDVQGAHCSRETFATAVDQVIVMSVACDKPGMVSFSAALSREQDAKASTIAPNRVVLDGEAVARSERHVDERKVGTNSEWWLKLLRQAARLGWLTKGEVIVEAADSRSSSLQPRQT